MVSAAGSKPGVRLSWTRCAPVKVNSTDLSRAGGSSHPATQPSHGFHAALDSRRFRWSPQCAQAVENAQAPGVRLEKDERAIRRVVKAPG
ncbi:MAG: hypothetical protein VYB34_14130 [Planctomycetota bacterium]|nr:hypothetical protein [Planctomycetota bacterium]